MYDTPHWSCNLSEADIIATAKSILIGVIDEGDAMGEAIDAIQVANDALNLTTIAGKRLNAATRHHCVEYTATYIAPTNDDLVAIVNAINEWELTL